MERRRLPLSDFPQTPLIFHWPEANDTAVSLDGADEGRPLSKFSVNLLSPKELTANSSNSVRNCSLLMFVFDVD
jgi:hypothetical protein